MKRAWIQREEWWPVLELHLDDDGPYEVDSGLIERYEQAYKEFDLIQNELHAYLAAQRGARAAS